MKIKEITISLAQRDELLNITLSTFKESNILQSIKEEHKWWIKNFLPNTIIHRVDRIEPLTFKIQYNVELIDECAYNIFDGRTDYSEMYE